MNKEMILRYMHCFQKADDSLNKQIDRCVEEVRQIAQFKAVHQAFTLSHDPLTIKELDLACDSTDLACYFQDISSCIVIACTLGISIDRRIKYYEHIDMAKAVVFDAVSSRYLEECCDEYEKKHVNSKTMRFAPGYGDIPLTLNKTLSNALRTYQTIGVSLTSSGLFTPMKSMLGIIGAKGNAKKSCMSCMRQSSCVFRKEGIRCYEND